MGSDRALQEGCARPRRRRPRGGCRPTTCAHSLLGCWPGCRLLEMLADPCCCTGAPRGVCCCTRENRTSWVRRPPWPLPPLALPLKARASAQPPSCSPARPPRLAQPPEGRSGQRTRRGEPHHPPRLTAHRPRAATAGPAPAHPWRGTPGARGGMRRQAQRAVGALGGRRGARGLATVVAWCGGALELSGGEPRSLAPPPPWCRRSLAAAHSPPLAHRPLRRGRNTEGQAGLSSYLPLALQPREVDSLAGLPVASLAAAKSHSAAVLESGGALTWGEGSDGKLGHGSTGAPRGPVGARQGRAGGPAMQLLLRLRRRCAALAVARTPTARLSTPPPPDVRSEQTAPTRLTPWRRWWGGCT